MPDDASPTIGLRRHVGRVRDVLYSYEGWELGARRKGGRVALGTTGPTVAEISEAVRDAARGTPIVRVYLFGSRARGEGAAGSDIDLALETDRGFSLVDAGLFAESVERGCARPVDVVSERWLDPAVRDSMLRDRVLVYER